MDKEKLGQEPAFPFVDDRPLFGNYPAVYSGMSTRLLIASQILSKLIVGYRKPEKHIQRSVSLAYKFTDELLNQENE